MYQYSRAGERGGADVVVGTLADHVELALERKVVAERLGPRDEHLAHERLAGARRLAKHAAARRHRAPTEHVQPLGLHHLLETLLHLPADGRVPRQENDAAAVLARDRQLDARLPAHLFVEGVRHLDQDAGAVARVDLGAAGAAVVQVLEHLDRLLDDPVRLLALDVDHESLATGVVLVARVVEPLFRRRAQLHRLVRKHARRCVGSAWGSRAARGSWWALPVGWRRCAQGPVGPGAQDPSSRTPDPIDDRGYGRHMTCEASRGQCTATNWSWSMPTCARTRTSAPREFRNPLM